MSTIHRTFPSQSAKRLLIPAAGLFFLIYLAYYLSGMVLANDITGLMFLVLAVVVGVAVLVILKDWRTGVLVFFGWLFFEDLARKYLGNNMAVYFGKDALVAIVYLSFFIAFRRHAVKISKPPFLVPLLVFFWFCFLQLFNPASTSFFIGVLGLKLYFYYVPLFFIGYAFVRTEVDLRRIFAFLMFISVIVTGLGIVQSILGHTFLNPAVIQEDIRDLSTTYRVAPISGAIVYRPTSVFVSGGRFAFFLVPAWLFSFGFGAYLIFRTRRYRMLAILALGISSVAIVLAASRGTLMWTAGSGLVCIPALLWGCPWQRGQLVRILRSFQRAVIGIILAVLVVYLFYPDAIKGRIAVYSETLDPNSSASELTFRARAYPLQQLANAFEYPRWPYGYGIGTASLGLQYVTRILHVQPMGLGVESGYGGLILELGLFGLFIYVFLLLSCWHVVLRLRGSPYFPIGFVIFWYAILFLLLYLWGGFQAFQDFILSSLLWFSLGVLFRLPTLPLTPSAEIATLRGSAAPVI